MQPSQPIIQEYMSYQVCTIDYEETLADASRAFAALETAYLPVLQSGKLAGVISKHDLELAAKIISLDPTRITAGYICRQCPYRVHPDTPLIQVAKKLIGLQLDYAIIEQEEKPIGIFTMEDACRALCEFMTGEQLLPSGRCGHKFDGRSTFGELYWPADYNEARAYRN